MSVKVVVAVGNRKIERCICSSGSLNYQWLCSQRTPLTMWLLWKAS